MKYPWLWTIMIWVIALLGLITMLPYNEKYQSIAALSCGSLGFVGAMPLIKNDKNLLHNVLAMIAGISSQLWVALVWDWETLAAWWTAYLIPLLINKNKWCFWAEIWCLVSIAATLLK